MFENKVVEGVYYGNVHYSRFIASYVKIASKHGKGFELGDFRKWLESIGKLTKDEIHAICNMANNGKLELEVSAESWFKNKEN